MSKNNNTVIVCNQNNLLFFLHVPKSGSERIRIYDILLRRSVTVTFGSGGKTGVSEIGVNGLAREIGLGNTTKLDEHRIEELFSEELVEKIFVCMKSQLEKQDLSPSLEEECHQKILKAYEDIPLYDMTEREE
jgi:hypothetical protein